MATYALDFDTAKLAALGVKLEGLTGADMGKAITTSLNDVVDKAYDLSRKRMIKGINLTDTYLRRKMVLTKATDARPVASILAEGLQTQLRNFGANMVLVPRTTARPDRNKGKLGIPKGMKQFGTSVEVPIGERQRFPHTFMLPLKRGDVDGGNGLGVFSRPKGGGKPRRMLGPAVYQLFKYQFKGTLLGETEEMLSTALATQVQAAIEKALDK